MELSVDALRNAPATEPSPSPPQTARVVVSPSHLRDGQQSCSNAPLTSPSQNAHHHSTSKSHSSSHPQHSSNPLASRTVNSAPVLQYKRRPAAHAIIPSPDVAWEAQEQQRQRRSDEISRRTHAADEEEEKIAEADTQTAVAPATVTAPRVSGGSSRGSGNSVSAARRSSVLGPDPRDCVDLPGGGSDDDEVEPQVLRVAPLPQEPYRRPLHPHTSAAPAPSRQNVSVRDAVIDDLSALVNADPVSRCRSDSHGQIQLTDDVDFLADAASVPPAQNSERGFGSTCLASPNKDNDKEGDEAVHSSRSASPAAAAAAYVDSEFAQEYFYYPASPCDAPDEAAAAESDERTPVRTRRDTSASPSSSMPRWARSLANETPFTPFAFSPAPAAASALPTPLPARGTAHHFDVQEGLSGELTGEQQQQQQRLSVLDSLVVNGGSQRLTVHDVVAAVLAAAPPLSTAAVTASTNGDGNGLRKKAGSLSADGEGDEVKDERHFDGPLDEPPPRRPPCSTSAQPSPPPPNAEREALMRHAEHVRARLTHADQLISRFDAVIAARQAELRTAETKHQELAQQTESHKARAAMARKDVRRLRDRQHAHEELQLLRDMMVDKENRLAVAQSRLLALRRLWQQLELLHAASTEKSALASERHRSRREGEKEGEKSSTASLEVSDKAGEHAARTAVEAEEANLVPLAKKVAQSLPLSPPLLLTAKPALQLLPPSSTTTKAKSAAPTGVDAAASPSSADICGEASIEKDEEVLSCRSDSCSSSASSLASLNTCDVLDDFLDELLMEVDGLAKVCIQLPSPPPTALSYCHRLKRPAELHSAAGKRGRATYSALNRRLNDGNNGFFSFFGGATEAHLNSKPLSTFLANLDRLRRTSWELEEEVQLRARELATDAEEEALRARLMVEYGLTAKTDPARSAEGDELAEAVLSPVTPLQPAQTVEVKDGALLLSAESDPLAVTASSDRITRQLFLSSPEHGRRSRGSVGSPSVTNSGRTEMNGGGLRSPLTASPLLRRPPTIQLLLPTLVYAYPRVAAVSQHLDAEQQTIQQDYAATIAAARQQRRELTAHLRETFRMQVAPALQQRIDVLRQQQASLARELGDLGVKEVVLEWEEEEPAEMDEAALWQLMDQVTAHGQRQLLGPRRRGNGAGARSRSRVSACSVAREDDGGYGEDASSSSRGVSLLRQDGCGGGHRAAHALSAERGAVEPPTEVYRRIVRVVCAATDSKCSRGEDREVPVSERDSRRRRTSQSARRKTPLHSGRRSSGAGVAASRNSACGASLALPDQSTASASCTPGNKTCADLQLYTYAPSQQLMKVAQVRSRNGDDTIPSARTTTKGEDSKERRAATARGSVPPAQHRVVPIRTSSRRCSGGTPRVSGAAGASATTRAMAPPSPRHRTASQPVSPRLTGRSSHHGSARLTTATAPTLQPLVQDTRTRVSTDLATPPCGASAGAAGATPTAACGLWSPFEPTRNAFADGAVRVAITFTGAEAHRRQVAQAKQEAYQREFWKLREELARIDEDIFQLRTRHADLCAQQQRVEAEQEQKLAEAEAKVKKCRTFYKTLKRENKEWQDICDDLQRVLRDGE